MPVPATCPPDVLARLARVVVEFGDGCLNHLISMTDPGLSLGDLGNRPRIDAVVMLFSILSVMKIVSGVLVAVLLLHVQCGGACLLNSSGRAAVTLASTGSPEPPCHRHADTPSRDHTPKHDSNGPCDQGPLTQSTVSAAAKTGLNVAGVLPKGIETAVARDSISCAYSPEKPPHVRSASARISVLRI
jgi:hypothetical protein